MEQKLASSIKITVVAIIIGLSLCMPVSAEEGGCGHYAPGTTASFMDALPGKPGLAMANYFMYYDGNASASKQIPVGGRIAADLDSWAYADSILTLYDTSVKLLGGDYVIGAAIPYVWMKVEGKVTGPLGNTLQNSDKESGVGDIMVYPFMLGWTNGDLKYDFRFGVYAPTGEYDVNALANLGKNYWTFEPEVTASWLSSKMGLEASAYAGLDLSTENNDTDYQSGDVFHIDATVAQHLPAGPLGIVGLGANVFYYQQLTGDSGDGAKLLGDFEGHTIGVGPALSLIKKVGNTNLAAEVKWLPEADVEHRIKGDFIWFKIGLAF
jgi:hypothetical protein